MPQHGDVVRLISAAISLGVFVLEVWVLPPLLGGVRRAAWDCADLQEKPGFRRVGRPRGCRCRCRCKTQTQTRDEKMAAASG